MRRRRSASSTSSKARVHTSMARIIVHISPTSPGHAPAASPGHFCIPAQPLTTESISRARRTSVIGCATSSPHGRLAVAAFSSLDQQHPPTKVSGQPPNSPSSIRSARRSDLRWGGEITDLPALSHDRTIRACNSRRSLEPASLCSRPAADRTFKRCSTSSAPWVLSARATLSW